MESVRQEGFACCLLLNLNCEADGISLLTDLEMGLKTLFNGVKNKHASPQAGSLA